MADYSDYGRRFGSLFLAGIFVITTLAFTGILFWQTRNSDKDASENEQIASQLAENEETINPEASQGENMLQGTPLANFAPIAAAATELQITDLTVGTGEEVKEGATITAHYTGAYAVNGEIFESSKDGGQPATFPLSGVIQGWQSGVPGMKVGGIRRLVIPGTQAYGEAPEGYTPGSTDRPMGTLVFDIELVSIGQ